MLHKNNDKLDQLTRQIQNEDENIASLQNEISELASKLETQKAEHDKEIARLNLEIEELKKKIKTEDMFFDGLLINAARVGNSDRMGFALNMGANINAMDSEGFTPLYYSVLNGHYDIAKILLIKGASLETRFSQDNTILNIVSQRGDITAVKFILDNLPRDDREATLLLSVYESLSGHETHSEAQEKIVNIKQLLSNAMLFQAAKQGNVNLAKKAIERGADLDAQDEHMETALHKSSYFGHVETVSFLLEKSCSINKKDKHGQTPVETTVNSEIKDLFSDYRRKQVTIMQKNIRGFFGQKKYDQEKENFQKKSVTFFAHLAKVQNYKAITELANAIEENRFDDARKIINGTSKKQEEEVAGQKVSVNEDQLSDMRNLSI